MPTPGMGKYMRLHQQQEHSSPYSGITTLHSPYSPYAQQSSVSASPHHTLMALRTTLVLHNRYTLQQPILDHLPGSTHSIPL